MRLMQRLAISGLLSVILILLLTGTIVTRRDLASVVDRGVAPEERNEQQVNPAWVQDNVVPGQDEPETEGRESKEQDRRLDTKHKQSEPSAVGSPVASTPGVYVIRPPNPPLDDVTNQRREKVKEMMKHGWDNYVRYAWGKNELRPISKRGHSASIFGASNMGATIVDGLDTLYIMGLHDEFKQGRDWIAENLDFDIYMTFLTHRFNAKLFIEVMSFNIMLYLYIVKYYAVSLNSTNVKLLLEQISHDCNAITDAQEIKIIQKYASRGRLYTIYSGLFVYLGTVAFIFTLFIPDILNFLLPLDKQRPRIFPTPVECFFDQQKYFYLMVSDLSVIGAVGMTTFMASETLFMVFIQHACGLFAIASYRITHAFDDCKNVSVVNAKLLRGIKIHKQSLQFIEFMNSCFAVSYLVFSVLAIISLTVNMLRLFQAIESNLASDIFASGLYVLAHFCYVFWVNYFGQDLCDHSESVFVKTYNARWYMAPLYAQKLLLIVLQRSTKTCVFNVFEGILIASMEGFASIISLSVSYFTVLYSVKM